jgi:hypothetical protein
MGKMLFQFTRIGFCDDIHTKQRRARIKGLRRDLRPDGKIRFNQVTEALHETNEQRG